MSWEWVLAYVFLVALIAVRSGDVLTALRRVEARLDSIETELESLQEKEEPYFND